MTILLLSHAEDEHARVVSRELAGMGVDHELVDTSLLPHPATVSWTAVPGQPDDLRIILPSGRSLRGDQVGAVWNRRRREPELPRIESPGVRGHVRDEVAALVAALPQLIPVAWLDPPDVVARAARKPVGLTVARSVGFPIPATVVGSDPRAVAELTTPGRDLALKSVSIPWVDLAGERVQGGAHGILLYTRRVPAAELRAHAQAVRNSPLTVQEYVPKDHELRVTVVGTEVFACGIWSQGSRAARDDWRAGDPAAIPHRAVELPDEVSDRCVELVRRLGLRFGCLDLVVTPDGDHVFLEINPNGQWLWVERLTGLPIGTAIAGLLLRLSADDRGDTTQPLRKLLGGEATHRDAALAG